MSDEARVERVAECGAVVHYRYKDATVRIGRFNVYACLKCLKVDCEHARAVREFAAGEPENAAPRVARAPLPSTRDTTITED